MGGGVNYRIESIKSCKTANRAHFHWIKFDAKDSIAALARKEKRNRRVFVRVKGGILKGDLHRPSGVFRPSRGSNNADAVAPWIANAHGPHCQRPSTLNLNKKTKGVKRPRLTKENNQDGGAGGGGKHNVEEVLKNRRAAVGGAKKSPTSADGGWTRAPPARRTRRRTALFGWRGTCSRFSALNKNTHTHTNSSQETVAHF